MNKFYDKKQEYNFTKRLLYEVRKEGCYLGDLKTGLETGMLFDKEYLKLKAGRVLKRTVTKVGDHSIDLRKVRGPEETWMSSLLKIETTGFIKDIQDLDEYSFTPGDNIEIRIKIFPKEQQIRINLKYEGRIE